MDGPIESVEERNARLDEEIESDLNRYVNAELRRIREWLETQRRNRIRQRGPNSDNKMSRQSAGTKRRKNSRLNPSGMKKTRKRIVRNYIRKTRRSKSKK